MHVHKHAADVLKLDFDFQKKLLFEERKRMEVGELGRQGL
jgi:hypothetical protein